MATDLIIMASSADRSGGDVAIPVAVGELTVTGNGAPGTATQWYPKSNGAIIGAFANSETGAAADVRFHKITDIDYNHLLTTHLQTDVVRSQILNRLNYPITIGDAIEAQATTAGAQLDVLGLYVAKNSGDKVPTTVQPDSLPAGAKLVHATSTFTHVADSIAEGTIVFDDFVPLRDVVYRIVAMGAHSATGCATRLRFVEGPNVNDTPGVPCADTSTGLEYQMFYGDFGSFKGQTPPRCQTIAVGADAATELYFVIVPGGSK